MSHKLTLARYLEGRGSVKSLTRIEAEAFGVQYPLVSGWPVRHGDKEISQAMLEDLAQRIAGARRSTASKALRGLDSIESLGFFRQSCSEGMRMRHPNLRPVEEDFMATSSFPGFALRPAKRSRNRRIWFR